MGLRCQRLWRHVLLEGFARHSSSALLLHSCYLVMVVLQVVSLVVFGINAFFICLS
jgi:hypothetical protein